MSDYHHGVRVMEKNTRNRITSNRAATVIGLVATADDADDAVFPENTPVLISSPAAAIHQAGTDGTLSSTLSAISNQAQTPCIVVRVPSGSDRASTINNVIGHTHDERYTGLQALLVARSQLGKQPTIIGAPGLEYDAVIAELATIAEKTGAFTYVCPKEATSKTDAMKTAAQTRKKEVVVIWPNVIHRDTTTQADIVVPSSAIALGLRAKIDQQHGWHHALSNHLVSGVSGLTNDVYWERHDSASDAALLNGQGVTTLINADGFRFWGCRTTSDNPQFIVESHARTAQVVARTLSDAHLSAIDTPMNPARITDIIERINRHFREMKAQGQLIDGHAWYDEAANDTNALSTGQLCIDYDYTPVPPLENLTLKQRMSGQFLSSSGSKASVFLDTALTYLGEAFTDLNRIWTYTTEE